MLLVPRNVKSSIKSSLFSLILQKRSHNHTREEFVRVIGSERCQAMAGAYETISLLRFLKFDFDSMCDFFPESSFFPPKLQQSIVNCGCEDVLRFILNDPVSGHFVPFSISKFAS